MDERGRAGEQKNAAQIEAHFVEVAGLLIDKPLFFLTPPLPTKQVAAPNSTMPNRLLSSVLSERGASSGKGRI